MHLLLKTKENKSDISYLKTSRAFDVVIHSGNTLVSRARPFFPVLVGVAGSAAGKKGLVSLGHIPLQRGMQ